MNRATKEFLLICGVIASGVVFVWGSSLWANNESSAPKPPGTVYKVQAVLQPNDKPEGEMSFTADDEFITAVIDVIDPNGCEVKCRWLVTDTPMRIEIVETKWKLIEAGVYEGVCKIHRTAFPVTFRAYPTDSHGATTEIEGTWRAE